MPLPERQQKSVCHGRCGVCAESLERQGGLLEVTARGRLASPDQSGAGCDSGQVNGEGPII